MQKGVGKYDGNIARPRELYRCDDRTEVKEYGGTGFANLDHTLTFGSNYTVQSCYFSTIFTKKKKNYLSKIDESIISFCFKKFSN